jgi:hypothetical protein
MAEVPTWGEGFGASALLVCEALCGNFVDDPVVVHGLLIRGILGGGLQVQAP